MTFGARLKARRGDLGLTQDELGEAIGVSKAAISRWESDKDYPSFEFLPRLKAALSVTLDDLVDGDSRDVRAVGETSAAYTVEFEHLAKGRDEMSLLRKFRSLSERRRRALIILLGAEPK